MSLCSSASDGLGMGKGFVKFAISAKHVLVLWSSGLALGNDCTAVSRLMKRAVPVATDFGTQRDSDEGAS